MKTIWKMLLFTGIAFAVMVSEARTEDYPKMKLRYANYIPEKAPNSKVDIFLAHELTKRTNGRVQVNIYHGETLGKYRFLLMVVLLFLFLGMFMDKISTLVVTVPNF